MFHQERIKIFENKILISILVTLKLNTLELFKKLSKNHADGQILKNQDITENEVLQILEISCRLNCHFRKMCPTKGHYLIKASYFGMGVDE